MVALTLLMAWAVRHLAEQFRDVVGLVAKWGLKDGRYQKWMLHHKSWVGAEECWSSQFLVYTAVEVVVAVLL